jgi:quercetin dioxygenase-like cupin family protein
MYVEKGAVTLSGRKVITTPQSLVLMPANVPHAVRATEASRMLLIMLREQVKVLEAT